MKWFKHDTTANMDRKLQDVLIDYGLEGYGLYWYCIELIAGKVDKDDITFSLEHDARIIARNTGSSAKKVSEIMSRFVELGLFEEEAGAITCMKLAKRLDKSMTSNPEMRNIIAKLKPNSHDPIMTESTKPMTVSPKSLTESCKTRLDKTRLDKKKGNQEFNKFWDCYPHKKSKDAARKAWLKLDPPKELIKEINQAVLNQIKERELITSVNEFCPEWTHGSTWLNGRRWEDDVDLSPRTMKLNGKQALNPLMQPRNINEMQSYD
jgi:hypothetical protein